MYSPSVAPVDIDGITGHAGKYFSLSFSIGPTMAGSSGGIFASGLSLRARSMEIAGLPIAAAALLDLGRRMPGEDAAVDVGLDPLRQRVHRVPAFDHRRDAGRAQHRVVDPISVAIDRRGLGIGRILGQRDHRVAQGVRARRRRDRRTRGWCRWNSCGNSWSRTFSSASLIAWIALSRTGIGSRRVGRDQVPGRSFRRPGSTGR